MSNQIVEILIFLKIVLQNKNRQKKYNILNPLTYVFLIIMFPISFLLEGFVGLCEYFKHILSGKPFKY